MSYPVIFIHYGDQEWLKYALLQAKEFNSEVILIGDESNNKYPFVKHYKITDYNESANKFKKVYKQLSRRDFKYELFCFERWFILEDFMRKHNLQYGFYQDSDNMLYIDVNEYNKLYNGNASFACFPWTGVDVFINSLDTLQRFCLFITKHYTDSSLFKELVTENKEILTHKNPGGGISDMELFTRFTKQHPSLIKNIQQTIDDSFFCMNLKISQEFETLGHLKKVYFLDKKLYCKYIPANKFLRCNTLQFQGNLKNYMQYFYKDTLRQLKGNFYFDYNSYNWIKIDS